MAESIPTEVRAVREKWSQLQGLVRRQVTAINKLLLDDQDQKRAEMSDLMSKLVTHRDSFTKVHIELLGMYEMAGLDDRDLLDSASRLVDESLTAYADADLWLKREGEGGIEGEIEELARELSSRSIHVDPQDEESKGVISMETIAKMQAQLDELQDSKRLVSDLQGPLDYNQRAHDQETESLRRTIVELRAREHSQSMGSHPLSSTARESGGHGRPSLNPQDISTIGQIISQSNVSIFKQILDQSATTQREMLKKSSETQQSICTSLKTAGVGLTKFRGSPLEYTSFIRRFDDYMGDTEAEPSVKLNILVEYCDAAVVEELECCFYKGAEEGYQLARRILKKKYGNPFLIAQAWVERLLSGAKLKSVESLAGFARSLRNCQETLSALGYIGEIECTNTMRILVSRLPGYLQNKWRKIHREAIENGKKAGLQQLIDLVQAAADKLSDPVYGSVSLGKVANSYDGSGSRARGESTGAKKKQSGGVYAQEVKAKVSEVKTPSASKKRTPKCWCCAGAHYTSVCPTFAKMLPADKLRFVKEKELCLLCMSSGHKIEGCYMRWTCQREGCGEKHHSALHDSLTNVQSKSGNSVNAMQEGGQPIESEEDDESSDEEDSITGVVSTLMGEYSLPLTPVLVKTGRGEFLTHVLLDSGSSVTLCTTRLFDRLGIKPHDRRHLWLGSMGGVVEVEADIIHMKMCRLGGEELRAAQNVSVVDKLPISDQHVAAARQIEKWPHLRELEMPTVVSSHVDMIIGQDNAHLLRHEREVAGRCMACSAVSVTVVVV